MLMTCQALRGRPLASSSDTPSSSKDQMLKLGDVIDALYIKHTLTKSHNFYFGVDGMLSVVHVIEGMQGRIQDGSKEGRE